MSNFGRRIRELRRERGYSLRDMGPLVGVGYTYLSKVERGQLDFGTVPSAGLIKRLADVLGADVDELMLLANKVPDSIAQRVLEQPEVFRVLAKCDAATLRRIARTIEPAIPKPRPKNIR